MRQRKEAQAQEIADAARAHGDEPAQLDPNSLPQPSILYVLVFIAGIYGGYFVAAQGVLLLGILGVFLLASMQSANAVKIFLVAAVNIVAAVSYILFSFERIDWWVVVLIAISSSVGSWLGAKVGRRLSPVALRTVIVILGLAALANMVRQVL